MEERDIMIGIDTNVIVRFLVDDDDEQNAEARRFLLARTVDDPAYLSAVALTEAIWVLNRRMAYPMRQVVSMLKDLLASDALVVEYTEELDALLSDDDTPAADFADYMIAWSGARAGCRATMTFDRTAARAVPGMELLA